jgi:glycosyltransferase involved in cell wall biosynthesis
MGKHGCNVTRELSRRADVSLRLLVARDQCGKDGRLPAGCGLEEVRATRLPFPSRVAHFAWRTMGWPPADFWNDDAEWVYSPSEQFVPARRAKTAATIHCVNWFEEDLPWSRTEQNLVDRRRMARVLVPLLERADLVVTVSGFLKERICELFRVKSERVAIVGNGVEDCFFEAGLDSGAGGAPAEGKRYLFAVAYPNRRKGFDRLIELADELARRRSCLKVRVAGSGLAPGQSLAEVGRLWGDEVTALLAEGLKRPNLELLGYRPAGEIARLMHQSVAVLVLSRYETFGIPALEAMAAGAPVIAANHAGLPETVGNAGVLVDPSRTTDLADVIAEIASKPAAWAQSMPRARARAGEFTWRACAERLVLELKRRI